MQRRRYRGAAQADSRDALSHVPKDAAAGCGGRMRDYKEPQGLLKSKYLAKTVRALEMFPANHSIIFCCCETWSTPIPICACRAVPCL